MITANGSALDKGQRQLVLLFKPFEDNSMIHETIDWQGRAARFLEEEAKHGREYSVLMPSEEIQRGQLITRIPWELNCKQRSCKDHIVSDEMAPATEQREDCKQSNCEDYLVAYLRKQDWREVVEHPEAWTGMFACAVRDQLQTSEVR